MPMVKPEDFGAMNPASLYCGHCTDSGGSLRSYDEVLEGMVNFMITSQNMDKETAGSAAREYMSRMPAWGK